MLSDIVIDTNILMHADNKSETRREHCCRFLDALRHSDTRLCLDEGFDPDEARNRSQIYGEYRKHLRPGMLGFALVAHLARSRRIKTVSRQVSNHAAQKIRQSVRNPQDRIYLRVALNSSSKTLASHDFDDFAPRIREKLRRDICVTIITADAAHIAIQRQ